MPELIPPIEKRPRYFDGQYLNVTDFTDEQNYHIDRQRRSLQFLHVSGILNGLEVSSNELVVTVIPGSAIDAQGRQILLQSTALIKTPSNTQGQLKDTPPFEINVEHPKSGTGSADYYLVIAYDEAYDEADLQTEAGSKEYRRYHERPILQVKNALTDQDVPLAKLSLSGSDIKIDSSIRRYSGVRFPSSNGSELSLRSQGNDQVTL